MGEWKKCGNEVCWEDKTTRIMVKLSSGDKDDDKYSVDLVEYVRCGDSNLKKECENEKVSIADVIVLEWKEIWVQVEGGEVGEVVELYFGSERAQKHRDEWRFTFRNYLGKSQIRLRTKDEREIITDPIEVISPKTLDKDNSLFYPKLLRTLIDDLVRYLVSLPFDWSAPTEFPTEERIQPPSSIFVLHILAQHADKIRFALQTVLRNPHRRLVTEERWVRLDEVSSVDADTVLMMLQHPEHLRRYHDHYHGTALKTLAERLKSRSGEKFVPERIFERRVTETLDTPENRFIKRFMDIVLFWCDELERQGYWQKAANHAPQLNDLRNFVRFARADPLFADVGEMEIFPASSQVLLKRDGYRECLQIYRLLHIARAPIFDRIQDAIDNRRIDQLYEFWCFFKLAKKLAGNGEFKLEPALQADDEGLRWGLKARLPDGYILVYNRQFEHGKGSYSVPLRPDFSLFRDKVSKNKPCVVFDAKFRFDESDVEQLDKKLVEQEMEEAAQKGDIERFAKHADICKMHTYRDALECRAAVVLYPGTKDLFFCTNGSRIKNVTVLQVVNWEGLEGVGAISFEPNST